VLTFANSTGRKVLEEKTTIDFCRCLLISTCIQEGGEELVAPPPFDFEEVNKIAIKWTLTPPLPPGL
jgi:hypothetical protein